MNKTQQEIMEIIEPYMDKTLSEGCIIVQCEKSDNSDLARYEYRWNEYIQIEYIKFLRNSTSKKADFSFWWDQLLLDFNWYKTSLNKVFSTAVLPPELNPCMFFNVIYRNQANICVDSLQ